MSKTFLKTLSMRIGRSVVAPPCCNSGPPLGTQTPVWEPLSEASLVYSLYVLSRHVHILNVRRCSYTPGNTVVNKEPGRAKVLGLAVVWSLYSVSRSQVECESSQM